jgi:hypothetical protein
VKYAKEKGGTMLKLNPESTMCTILRERIIRQKIKMVRENRKDARDISRINRNSRKLG